MRQIAVNPNIVYLHAEDAAFLWHRRRLEIDGPMLDKDEMGRLDQRLDANLEGLLAAGLAGWETSMKRFSLFPKAGEVFVLASLAWRWNDPEALDAALQAAQTAGDEGVLGFSGSIAHSSPENLGRTVAKWLNSPDKTLQYFGLCALSHHRVDPKDDLIDFLADPDLPIRIRAQRLAGELGRLDVLPLLARGLEAQEAEERFVAASAACLLGDTQSALPVLEELIDDDALALKAMEMWLVASPRDAAGRWLQEQLENPDRRVAATACLGLSGDREIIPWLIQAMGDPSLVQAAGVALQDLFEIDFNDTGLFSHDPELFPEEFDELPEAAQLPVADRVAAWWDERQWEGEPIYKSMRQLRFESLRATIANPGKPLENWRQTRRFPCWM